MQKPGVFPRFTQLCLELLHIIGFKYFTWQRVPVIYHPVGDINCLKFSLIGCFVSFFPWARVSLEFIVKKSLASRSSMPVMMRNVWIMSMYLLLYRRLDKCRSSVCIFQLGNIYFHMRTPNAFRVVHVRSHQ